MFTVCILCFHCRHGQVGRQSLHIIHCCPTILSHGEHTISYFVLYSMILYKNWMCSNSITSSRLRFFHRCLFSYQSPAVELNYLHKHISYDSKEETLISIFPLFYEKSALQKIIIFVFDLNIPLFLVNLNPIHQMERTNIEHEHKHTLFRPLHHKPLTP